MTDITVKHDWAANQWDWPLQHNDGVVLVVNTKDKFEVGLDCQFFTPNEIEVKVTGDKLVVHCNHQIRSDSHGEIKREVHRAYQLPPDVDVKTLKSYLNNKGVLNITANKKA